jgi:pimeloyl-ACP methyl ester carboxylesterase
VDELTVSADGAELAVSRSPGDDLELVALHGSEPGTRDGALYRQLHEVLPPLGIGVVTFDRRGSGASTGSTSRGDLELQADDCLAIVDALAARRVGLWGFSQGGWVAPIAAARRADVACVVTVGAPGVTPHQQMRYGVARHLRDAGYDEATVREVDRLWVDALRALRGDAGALEELPARLRAAAVEPWWPLAFLPEAVPAGAIREALLREMEHDPRPSFASVRCPVLAIYGADDEWTPVEESVRTWRAAQGDNVTIAVLDGGHHDPLDGDARVEAEYGRVLADWVRRI